MILLSVDEVISLHTKLIVKTGGIDGIRDIGLLESAVFGAQASFDDIEQYPTIEEKAARLMYALIRNHAFVDGNKRIGTFIMLMTLRLNNIIINYSQKELIELALSVASQNIGYEDILTWICNHKQLI